MFELLEGSHGNTLGLRAVGTITHDDYAWLVPQVGKLVETYGQVRLLCDLGNFQSEAADAWLADFQFGLEYHDKIVKMALVGERRWEAWVARLAAPLYAREARYFPSAQIDMAWAWVRS
ncbi:MAG: STAS/SEC14 domain-containing protein [Caldilineaceae bacterium]|nr:STAS/SEC14 domain-containing protein [Caldilineaceae bacterium]